MMPTPPWQRSRPAREPRRALSREAIVDAAARILDQEGAEAMSMRRVAQALGTGPASLYAHVSGKEELEALVLDRIAAEITLPEPDPDRWQEQVKEVLRGSVAMLERHPGAARMAMATIPTGENMLIVTERLLAIMRGAGVPDQVAAYAVDLLHMYAVATALEGDIYREAGKSEESFSDITGSIRTFIESLPVDRFPNLVAVAGPMVTGGGAERFEFGLDILVAGIAAHARPAPAEPPA